MTAARHYTIGSRVRALATDPWARDTGTVVSLAPMRVKWDKAATTYTEDPTDTTIIPLDPSDDPHIPD